MLISTSLIPGTSEGTRALILVCPKRGETLVNTPEEGFGVTPKEQFHDVFCVQNFPELRKKKKVLSN